MSDGDTIAAGGGGDGGGGLGAGEMRRAAVAVDHGELAPVVMGRAGDQRRNGIACGGAGGQQVEAERPQSGIRPMLGQHGADPGAGKGAAAADRHARGGDGDAEHARSRASAGNRESHQAPLLRLPRRNTNFLRRPLGAIYGVRAVIAPSTPGSAAPRRKRPLPMSAPTSVPLMRVYWRARPTWRSMRSATWRPSQPATTSAM